MIERIDPDSLRSPEEYYTHVIKAGNMVFVAGQVAVGKDRKIIGADDITVQAEETFRQVRACLRAAGTDFQFVVKLNTFITNPDHVDPVGEVRTRLLHQEGLRPASTLVVVKSLAKPDQLIEVECIALCPAASDR